MKNLYVQKTSGNAEEICRNVEREALKHRFAVLSVQDMKKNLSSQNIEIAQECLIVEVCNPLLFGNGNGNGVDGALFPLKSYRITVTQDKEGISVSTILRNGEAAAISDDTLRESVAAEEAAVKEIIRSACSRPSREDAVLRWNMC